MSASNRERIDVMAATATESETLLRAIGAGPDHPIDVAAAALALSALDASRAETTPYSQHLTDVARAVGQKTVRTVEDAHSALRTVLSNDHGYVGDDQTYDDLQNANLMHVIDRRKGLPVALGCPLGRSIGVVPNLSLEDHFGSPRFEELGLGGWRIGGQIDRRRRPRKPAGIRDTEAVVAS